MSNHIEDKDTEHFPSTEEMRKRMDEMDKMFAGAKQNLDAIITMLDETLTQEEDFCGEGITGIALDVQGICPWKSRNFYSIETQNSNRKKYNQAWND